MVTGDIVDQRTSRVKVPWGTARSGAGTRIPKLAQIATVKRGKPRQTDNTAFQAMRGTPGLHRKVLGLWLTAGVKSKEKHLMKRQPRTGTLV